MINKTQFLAYLMHLADEYGNSDTMFSCFSCGEDNEDQIPLDKVTYNLLDEARDGLPEDICHPENDGFIYVNSIAENGYGLC